MSMYHDCPRCHAPIAPAHVTADPDWKTCQLDSGAIEFRRDFLIECQACDRDHLVTVARDDRERERVIKVDTVQVGGTPAS